MESYEQTCSTFLKINAKSKLATDGDVRGEMYHISVGRPPPRIRVHTLIYLFFVFVLTLEVW